MIRNRILVIDDEPGMLEVCRDTLQRLPGIEVVVEQNGARAAERLAAERWELVVADIRMPGIGGIDLLRTARQRDPHVGVLMMTAFPSVETALESMKLGAADYIVKPFLPEDLLATVSRLLDGAHLREENRLLRRQVDNAYAFGEIIGKSPAMQAIFDMIHKVAQTDADVLILGETGTGKELVARSIHQRGRRSANRFVPLNCSAIPEDLLESELFGHERGAFTGAHTRSLGLLEFADKGTFFFDEVGELHPRLQAKLLRALQERKIRRVGGQKEVDVDVRVIAATSRDLDREVREQRFRGDLYYRINVARIELPALRDHAEDIPFLVEHFVERYAREMGKGDVQIGSEVLEVLSAYRWPGNVRELQNVLKRTLAMARRETIAVEDLPDEIVSRAGDSRAKSRGGFFDMREKHMASFERDYFANLLRSCQGDVTQAARQALLPRGTLYRLLKKHDLTPERFRGESPGAGGSEAHWSI
jgi:DNA-binding NtrC family response regulator